MTADATLKAKAAAAYNAAADTYDAPANTFWDRFGAATVARLGLRPGMRVLDVCSGTGASAIPAAQAVGPTGQVIAVDVAENLLARLRAKADRLDLPQIETRGGDLLDLPLPADATFAAVVCVFGIFFVADMAEGLRQLWRRVAPGGQLAITTWGDHAFEPADSLFWTAVRAERPDLYKRFNPWDAITTPDALAALFGVAEVPDARVVAENGTHPVPSPAAAWALIMGSGYRGTVEQLTAGERARVEARYLSDLAARRIANITANVLYAVTRR
jgi:ubiquinone/menaquinone biosynthesis C-methylase UbiE